MIFNRSRSLLLAAAVLSSAFGQTGPAPDGGDGLTLGLIPESPNTFEASWWGRSGRTYYLLRSADLVTWEYFPAIETGQNETIRYGFTSESSRVFIRLRYEDQTYSDPYALDSDGDGLTNQQELDLNLRTDPFAADSDGDGLLDKWEIAHGYDPRDPSTGFDTDGDLLPDVWETAYFGDLARDGSGHFDSDGINDRQEFILGARPNDDAHLSTSIGLSILEP
jgi:hypothetical protein